MILISAIKRLFTRKKPAERKIVDGWYLPATREHMPGGKPMKPKLLVIHFTAGATGISSINYWRKKNNGICAHFVIERDGSVIQVRELDKTCAHCGKSAWKSPISGQRHTNLNSQSIGIEMANGGYSFPSEFSKLKPLEAIHRNGGPKRKWETYTKAQLESCETLSKLLVQQFELEDVRGHEDIAPMRKADPGPAFPLDKLRKSCGVA